jgi:hypothetical protein
MTEEEKTKNPDLVDKAGDKAGEGDANFFLPGKKKDCPVQYFKKLLTVLKPGKALFKRPN